MGTILHFIMILAFSYACVVVAIYIFQRKMLYLPTQTPDYQKRLSIESLNITRVTTEDKLRLIAWHLNGDPGMPTILYFHGNSGTLFDRADKYRLLNQQGFGVIALSYRGFSGNPGAPSEQGLYKDGRAAIAYAKAQGIEENALILYGESLGSGVAVQMATEMKPAAIILEAPYTSVRGRAEELYPYLPVKYMIKDHFDNMEKIGNVTAPVLILHGEKDETIPAQHGQLLLATANEPKKGIFYPNVGHVDFDMEELTREVKKFVQEQGVVQSE